MTRNRSSTTGEGNRDEISGAHWNLPLQNFPWIVQATDWSGVMMTNNISLQIGCPHSYFDPYLLSGLIRKLAIHTKHKLISSITQGKMVNWKTSSSHYTPLRTHTPNSIMTQYWFVSWSTFIHNYTWQNHETSFSICLCAIAVRFPWSPDKGERSDPWRAELGHTSLCWGECGRWYLL